MCNPIPFWQVETRARFKTSLNKFFRMGHNVMWGGGRIENFELTAGTATILLAETEREVIPHPLYRLP